MILLTLFTAYSILYELLVATRSFGNQQPHTPWGLETNGNFTAYRCGLGLLDHNGLGDQMANPTILLVINKINLYFSVMQQGTCHDLYSINILCSLGVLGVIK